MQHPAVLGRVFAENILKIEAWKPICQVEVCRRWNPGYRDTKLGCELSCPPRLILAEGAHPRVEGGAEWPCLHGLQPSTRILEARLSLTIAAFVVPGIWKTTRSASSREAPSRIWSSWSDCKYSTTSFLEKPYLFVNWLCCGLAKKKKGSNV